VRYRFRFSLAPVLLVLWLPSVLSQLLQLFMLLMVVCASYCILLSVPTKLMAELLPGPPHNASPVILKSAFFNNVCLPVRPDIHLEC